MNLIKRLFSLCGKKSEIYNINKQRSTRQSETEASTSRTCSYDDAVELTGHGRYNYLQLAACSIICNAVAIDMFGFGVVLAAATCDLNLGILETALLASVPFTGIIYSFAWGYFSDRCGRRRALLLSTMGGFLFAALSSFSPNWQTMFVLKIFGYAFSSAGFNLTITYLGESTGDARRSRYLFIVTSADLAGELVFYTIAYFVLPQDFAVPIPWLGIVLRPWRVYTLLLATPLGLGAIFLLMLRESPKFLASRGMEEKALQVLETMYVANGGKKGEYPVKSLAADNVDVPSESFCNTFLKQAAPLFKPPLVGRTIQLFYILAICCSTNFVFVMWYPAIMNLFFNSLKESDDKEQTFCERVVSTSNVTFSHTGHSENESTCSDTISMNTIYCGIALSFVFVSLNLAASTVAKYRRLVLQACLLVAAVSLILVDLVYEPIAGMVLFTLVQCTAIGIGSVASYFVDLYPTAVRGLVTSLGITTGQLVSLGGVNLIGAVILDYCSVTFYGWAAFVCSGLVATLFLPSDNDELCKINNNNMNNK